MAVEMNGGDESGERRRYFRIEDDVHLALQLVTAETYERVRAEPPAEGDSACDLILQLRALASQASIVLSTIRKEHPDIAGYLALQDRKIDLVAGALVGRQLDEGLTANAHIDISGGGIAYPSAEPVPVGTALLVKVVFFPSHLCIQAYGQVVHCKRDDNPADQPYKVGVEFTVISETARDALIRHTLERQSEQLRRQRDRR